MQLLNRKAVSMVVLQQNGHLERRRLPAQQTLLYITTLPAVKARKLAYHGHTMTKQGSCLEKEIMQETMPGAHTQGRPRTAWMDIKMWTRLPMEQSITMTAERESMSTPRCGQCLDREQL